MEFLQMAKDLIKLSRFEYKKGKFCCVNCGAYEDNNKVINHIGSCSVPLAEQYLLKEGE